MPAWACVFLKTAAYSTRIQLTRRAQSVRICHASWLPFFQSWQGAVCRWLVLTTWPAEHEVVAQWVTLLPFSNTHLWMDWLVSRSLSTVPCDVFKSPRSVLPLGVPFTPTPAPDNQAALALFTSRFPITPEQHSSIPWLCFQIIAALSPHSCETHCHLSHVAELGALHIYIFF